ncbi:MAG TPA: hypothetical protein VI316_11605 [Candidatus Dormibacteraeota bacterium]
MPRTRKPPAAPPPPSDVVETEPEDAVEEEVEPDADEVAAVEVEEEDDDEDDDEDDEPVVDVAGGVIAAVDDDLVDEIEVEVVKPVVAVRPAGRPSPGRPPGAKEEPDPPFYVGERIRLTQNTRPRTGALLGDYPVGAEGRVETVLSMTCILRFDLAPDTKEVVAFQCIESIDDEAMARRAERDALKAAEAAAQAPA